MNDTPATPETPHAASHLVGYPRFLWRSMVLATDGNLLFYAWMTALTAVFLVGLNAWTYQVSEGMIRTHMTDHVSWGLYIANFTFLVGLAAGGVMMVIPAYLYHDREMHDIVIIGELLAIAAILMCTGFVVVDLGRPDRFWHLIPGIGRFNWPISMLTWDVIVLNGYLLLNLHICGYLLYTRFLGREPNPRWYVPFVFLSIVWAISIHTVTAFLYCGLGGRPLWNSALLAPRFLASAFVSGPAFIIVTLLALRKFAGLASSDGPIRTLLAIIRVAILINLLMLASELFTAFYTGGAHAASLRYLFFGLHGAHALVPWAWLSVA
ncbi:MAG: NrfD/PsrC family molybdoenzyme membrane anchor subunit, partial [Gemmataceae bacterium]